MSIHTIITHEHPDLDAIVSVLMMTRFGEERLPGVSTAEIKFCSANKLPFNKTPSQLEREGYLLLDIGGGRFDTHPVDNRKNEQKRDRCAADLVGEFLGLLDDPDWKMLIEYTRMQDTTGHSMFSKNYLHHMVSIHSFLLGMELLYPDSRDMLQNGIKLVETIPCYQNHKNDELDIDGLLKNFFQRYFASQGPDFDRTAPRMENLNKWLAIFEKTPAEAFPNIEMDIPVTLKSLITGAFFKCDRNVDEAYKLFDLCVRAIIKREEEWITALDECRSNAVITSFGKISICSVESASRLMMKAVRYLHKSDVLIFRNANDKATTISINKNGPFRNFNLSRLAGFIRIVECALMGVTPDYQRIEEVGDVHGWFLHQSFQLLLRGSSKATEFVPSLIPMDDMHKIVCYFINNKKASDEDLPPQYLKLYLQYTNPFFRQK